MAINMSHWETPVIHKAIDLEQFKKIKGNRETNKAHKKKLTEAIKHNANILKHDPILVNEKKEIIDGQHRWESAKDLGLPIFYIQIPGLGLKDAQMINSSSKQWRPMDYALSYRTLGYKPYADYVDLKTRFDVNHDVLIRFMSLDEGITNEMFRDGMLTCHDLKTTERLLWELVQLKEIYQRATHRAFALAYKEFARRPEYDFGRMLQRFREYVNELQDYAVPEQYTRKFEEIYNAIARK